MAMYKSKKNIKSKMSKKKTRKRISKIKGGALVKGDCGLYFKNQYAASKFRHFVFTTSSIRKDKEKKFTNWEDKQACVNQIKANYINSKSSNSNSNSSS
jgi:hypothetical protein